MNLNNGMLYSARTSRYEVGDKIFYNCDLGYVSDSGAQDSSCEVTGDTANWSPEIPTCIGKPLNSGNFPYKCLFVIYAFSRLG